MEQILVDAGNDVDAVFAANDGLATHDQCARGRPASGAGAGERPGRHHGGHPERAPRQADRDLYKPIQDEAGVAAAR